MRFRKETLGWTLPRVQNAQTRDTWTQLVALAHWMLFLARPLVQDNPLPWQKAQTRLTPQSVRQSLGTMLRHAQHKFSCKLEHLPSLPNCAENRPAGPKASAERPKYGTK